MPLFKEWIFQVHTCFSGYVAHYTVTKILTAVPEAPVEPAAEVPVEEPAVPADAAPVDPVAAEPAAAEVAAPVVNPEEEKHEKEA